MLLNVLPLTALLLLTPQIFGAAVGTSLEARRFPKCKDGKPQGQCLYDAKGHIQIGLEDHRINFGTVGMHKLVQSMREHCDPVSACDDSWTIPTQIVDRDHNLLDAFVVVKNLNTDYAGALRHGLFDALEAALQHGVNVTQRTYGIPRQGASLNLPEGVTQVVEPDSFPANPTTQFIGHRKIGLVLPKSKKFDAQRLAFECHIEFPEEGSICGILGTVAAGAGAALSLQPELAPLGFGLTLLSLVCGV